jgi:hypothetical protein
MLMLPSYRETNPKYLWCLGCERVSTTQQVPGFYFTCTYPDCPLHRLEDDRPFTVGGWWVYLRLKYHPEYPETPAFGIRYAMLEFREWIAHREPQNPFLSGTATA